MKKDYTMVIVAAIFLIFLLFVMSCSLSKYTSTNTDKVTLICIFTAPAEFGTGGSSFTGASVTVDECIDSTCKSLVTPIPSGVTGFAKQVITFPAPLQASSSGSVSITLSGFTYGATYQVSVALVNDLNVVGGSVSGSILIPISVPKATVSPGTAGNLVLNLSIKNPYTDKFVVTPDNTDFISADKKIKGLKMTTSISNGKDTGHGYWKTAWDGYRFGIVPGKNADNDLKDQIWMVGPYLKSDNKNYKAITPVLTTDGRWATFDDSGNLLEAQNSPNAVGTYVYIVQPDNNVVIYPSDKTGNPTGGHTWARW